MDTSRTVRILLNLGILVGTIGLVLYLMNLNRLSEDTITWGILILVLGFMAISLVFNAWAGRKRKEALQQAAAEMGFSFLPDDKDFNNQIQASTSLDLFTKGRSRKAYNLLRGQRRDAAIVLFDYKYTTGGGRSSQTHHQTAILFTLEQSDMTQFSLRPRGLFDKMAAKFRQKEIDFETAPEFSKKYLVKGSDEAAIRRIFNTSVVAFYEGQQGLSTEASTNQLLFYRQGKRVKPEELSAFLENAAQLLALLRKPSYDFSYPR